MTLKLYSVKDKLVGFTGPIAMKDDKVAMRWFDAFCEQKKQREFTDAKYYELYEVGTFNTETGETNGLPFSQMVLIREGEQIDGKMSVREQTN